MEDEMEMAMEKDVIRVESCLVKEQFQIIACLLR